VIPSGTSLPRLYAILDVDLLRARGLDATSVARTWLDAGVRLIQLRAKTMATGPMLELADALVAAGHADAARVIVNDRADVARMSGADGVHVGQEDLSPTAVRALVGESAIVGLSTHTDAQVEAACDEPISYLAIGPVFESATKTQIYSPVGLDGVARAAARAREAGLPLVAIGGITLDTARSVIEAGAQSVAVISDLIGGDPSRRVRDFLVGVDAI
jgi:thiamine-phosphate pyrophosphorylase